jgi:hypothetical protein
MINLKGSRKADLSNSIYQQKGSGFGLTQKDGMLINNMPDGITGIQKAVGMKKIIKREEKISTFSEGIMLSKNVMGGCDCSM